MQGRYLLGLGPVENTLEFLYKQTETPIHPADIAQRNDHAAQYRVSRAPSVTPTPLPIPSEFQDHISAVKQRPLFQKLFADHNVRFALFDIASLIPVQPHVIFDFAKDRAGCAPSAAEVYQLCLPPTPQALEIKGGVTTSGAREIACTLVTPDLNVLVSEAKLDTENGLKVIFTVSKTAVFCQIQSSGGRFFVRDGTHRAVGLLAAGVRHMPAIVEEVPPHKVSNFLPEDSLFGPHPPRIADFLDPFLYIEHPWALHKKVVRIIVDEFVTSI